MASGNTPSTGHNPNNNNGGGGKVTTHISSDPITINYASSSPWYLRMEIAINVVPTEIAFQHERKQTWTK